MLCATQPSFEQVRSSCAGDHFQQHQLTTVMNGTTHPYWAPNPVQRDPSRQKSWVTESSSAPSPAQNESINAQRQPEYLAERSMNTVYHSQRHNGRTTSSTTSQDYLQPYPAQTSTLLFAQIKPPFHNTANRNHETQLMQQRQDTEGILRAEELLKAENSLAMIAHERMRHATEYSQIDHERQVQLYRPQQERQREIALIEQTRLVEDVRIEQEQRNEAIRAQEERRPDQESRERSHRVIKQQAFPAPSGLASASTSESAFPPSQPVAPAPGPSRNQLIAFSILEYLTSTNPAGSHGLRQEQVVDYLDAQPTYYALCDWLEHSGYAVNKTQLANTIYQAVPEIVAPQSTSETSPVDSSQGSVSTEPLIPDITSAPPPPTRSIPVSSIIHPHSIHNETAELHVPISPPESAFVQPGQISALANNVEYDPSQCTPPIADGLNPPANVLRYSPPLLIPASLEAITLIPKEAPPTTAEVTKPHQSPNAPPPASVNFLGDSDGDDDGIDISLDIFKSSHTIAPAAASRSDIQEPLSTARKTKYAPVDSQRAPSVYVPISQPIPRAPPGIPQPTPAPPRRRGPRPKPSQPNVMILPINPAKMVIRSAFNPDTIVRDILMASGVFPEAVPPLNQPFIHLRNMIPNVISDHADLSTLNWPLISGALGFKTHITPRDGEALDADDEADPADDKSLRPIHSAGEIPTQPPRKRARPRKPKITGFGATPSRDVPNSGPSQGETRSGQFMPINKHQAPSNSQAYHPFTSGNNSSWQSGSQPSPEILRENRGNSRRPQRTEFKCQWKDCQTKLHNLRTLQKHVLVTHVKSASEDGQYFCRWSGCPSKRSTLSTFQYGGNINEQGGLSGSALLSYTRLEDWTIHIDIHISAIELRQGVGPTAGLSETEASESYMSDSHGRAVTPRVSAVLKPNQMYEAKPMHARALEIQGIVRQRKKAVGPSMDRTGAILANSGLRDCFLDDIDFEEVIDTDGPFRFWQPEGRKNVERREEPDQGDPMLVSD